MDNFETGADPFEVTRNGMLGGPVDDERRFGPGVQWFRINGVNVSEEEFKRRWAEQHGEIPAASVKD
jgi:hypothetical protein